MGLSGHQSARMKSDTWLTPPEWIEKLGPFDLDPCCPPNMPWKTAWRHFVRPEDCGICDGTGSVQLGASPSSCTFCDGLKQPWRGRVWLNPPFGTQAAEWLQKLAHHGNGIALIPARTETAMFYRHVWGMADTVCFVKGRPHFHFANGERAPFNSGAPIALVAYGNLNSQSLYRARLGILVDACGVDDDIWAEATA